MEASDASLRARAQAVVMLTTSEVAIDLVVCICEFFVICFFDNN